MDGTAEAPGPHVLRDYALLADGERGALVGPHGDIAWMCFPRWHSDAVFASLLGGRSTFTVRPRARHVWGGHYEDGTLIWRSRWVTGDGIIECREALAFPGEQRRAVLLRRIVAVEGPARVEVLLDPVAGFDRFHLRDPHRGEDGTWTARVGGLQLRWTGADGAALEGRGRARRLRTELTVPAGGTHDLVLELSDGPLTDNAPEPGPLWDGTEAAWRDGVAPPARTIAPRDSRLAAAVLRGLTADGGGMVAAATTGLPERADMGRNFDYRYVWIRDQCYAGQAAAAAGDDAALARWVRFVTERVLDDGPRMAPAYTVDGGRVPPERALALPGYPGGSGIVGNRVRDQFQLDAFGEVLLLLAAAARRGIAGRAEHRAIAAAVAAIARLWRRPDAGIWELEPDRWTQSRLICAAGLRAVASAGGVRDAAGCSALADALVADAARDGLHPTGRWQRAPGDPRVDAALLLPAVRGAVPADDPRSVATSRAVRDELSVEHFVHRFRHDHRPLGTTEGAFLVCGFWMALAAHGRGDAAAALRWFECSRSAAGSPGLLAEEYDVEQRQLRGNLPQAFVHALLMESAARLAGP